jgi:hypothetical protein
MPRAHDYHGHALLIIVGKPMAELHAAKRNKLPKKSFGLPGSRKYPMQRRYARSWGRRFG